MFCLLSLSVRICVISKGVVVAKRDLNVKKRETG